MSYDKADPRAGLASAGPVGAEFTSYRPSDYQRFYEMPPQKQTAQGRTWLSRGSTAIISYAELKAGAEFERSAQPDEWVLLLPDAAARVKVTAGGATHDIGGYSISFIPPGPCKVEVIAAGRAVGMFTTQSADLAEACGNHAAYVSPNPNIPAYAPWPAPAGGLKLRTYSLDVPQQPGRFGRIWRCTTFMVNVFYPHMGPRDITKLSPHHHDTFEQYSLALEGSFIHHLRWAWTPNMKMWRPDEAEFCGTPSLAIIPPPAIHTTRSLDPGANLLVDIFTPPRMDFTRMDGWVLNSTDYPVPA